MVLATNSDMKSRICDPSRKHQTWLKVDQPLFHFDTVPPVASKPQLLMRMAPFAGGLNWATVRQTAALSQPLSQLNTLIQSLMVIFDLNTHSQNTQHSYYSVCKHMRFSHFLLYPLMWKRYISVCICGYTLSQANSINGFLVWGSIHCWSTLEQLALKP